MRGDYKTDLKCINLEFGIPGTEHLSTYSKVQGSGLILVT
jgi:hypothetical protein